MRVGEKNCPYQKHSRTTNWPLELSREHRRLKEILEVFDDIISLKSQITDCESLIDDPEMGEEAREEIESSEKSDEKSTNLTISMLPPDPETGKIIL